MRDATTHPRESARLEHLLRALVVPWSGDFVFIVVAFGVPLGLAGHFFGADGDIGRHLRVGTDILRSGSLFFLDPYSYTMSGQPFVPYEWLSEVSFALAYDVGGLAAVAVFTGLIAALTSYLVVVYLRMRGAEPLLAAAVGCASAVLLAIHLLARPHVFTSLLAIVVLILLERSSRRSLIWFAPVFVLWANLHGGFTFGLILIGCFVAGDLAEWALRGRPRTWLDRAAYHLAALGISALACLINPSGLRLYSHVVRFLGDHYIADHTLEYLSPDFHTPAGQVILLALLAMIAILALGPVRADLPQLAVVLVTVAFSLYSQRNVDLFAVTALPLLALIIDGAWRGFSPLQRYRRMVSNGELGSRPGVWAGYCLIFLTILAVSHGQFAGLTVASSFDPAKFPVAAVEEARRGGLTGRMYNEFIWGGYVLYAWPEEQVFIDGQTDFYGDALFSEYLQISELKAGWRDALRARQIDFVLIGSDTLLSRELAREPGWYVWYIDATATILRRRG